MKTGQVTLPKAEEARVVTGLFFPSSGTKIPSTLTVTTGIEEASEGVLMMASVGDWVMADSGGGIPGASFSMRGPGGDIPYTSRDVRDITLRSINEEFGAAAQDIIRSNILYDLSSNLEMITKALEPLMKKMGAGEQDDLTRLIVASLMEATEGPATATGFIQSSYKRLALLKGGQFALEALPRLADAIQTRMPDYFAQHPSHYDHAILDKTLRKYFGSVTVSDACKTLLLNAYNHNTQQTEVMGAFLGDLGQAPDRDSSFQELEAGEATLNRVPLYTKTLIADAIMAMTSIDGLIGRYQVPGMPFMHKDMADFPATLLRNVMDEVSLRMEKHLHEQLEKTQKRNFWGRRQTNITPGIVQRLVIIGNGYEDQNHPDRYAREGVGVKLAQYPGSASRAALSPVFAGINARYDRLSQYYTGLSAMVDINAPLMPAANDADAHRYPSTSISEGTVPMLAKHTWFGAHRIFKTNAEKIMNEMVFALQGMREREEISGERYDTTVKNIRARLQDDKKLEAFCDYLTMGEKQVESAIARDIPAKTAENWKAVPSYAIKRLTQSRMGMPV